MRSKNKPGIETVGEAMEELTLHELDGVRGGFRADPEVRPGLFHQRAVRLASPHVRDNGQSPQVREFRPGVSRGNRD